MSELNFNPLVEDPEKLNAVIQQHIAQHIDFVTLSRLTLGKNWRQATQQQRSQFTREIGRLLVRIYSTALAGYANQKIEYFASNISADQRRATVRSRILDDRRAPLAIDYSLRKVSDHWKIYDVKIDGISLVTTYRSSYGQAVQSKSLDVLINELKEKNNNLDAG